MPERTYIIFDDIKDFFTFEESITNSQGITRYNDKPWVQYVCLSCTESGRVPSRGNFVTSENYSKGAAVKHWKKVHHPGPVSVQVDGPVAPDPSIITTHELREGINARLNQYIADHTMADDMDEMSEIDFATHLIWIKGWEDRDGSMHYFTGEKVI